MRAHHFIFRKTVFISFAPRPETNGERAIQFFVGHNPPTPFCTLFFLSLVAKHASTLGDCRGPLPLAISALSTQQQAQRNCILTQVLCYTNNRLPRPFLAGHRRDARSIWLTSGQYYAAL